MKSRLFSLVIKRRISFSLLCLLLTGISFLSIPAPAAETISDTIKVVYSRDGIPFHFINSEGKPDGMVIDKWKLWSRKTGIPVEFIPASWDDTLKFVKNGQAQAHAGLFLNKERDMFLDYGQPLIKSNTHMFYDKSLPPPEAMNAFLAYRVGVLKGDFVVSWLAANMPGLSLVSYETYDELMTALKNGELMVFAADTLTALNHLGRSNLRQQFNFKSNSPLYSNDFSPAVKQGNTQLLKTIMAGMDKITESESREIYRQWASGSKEKDTGALIIAIDREYPPLSILDPEGNPSGLLVDMWELWSKTTGLKIQFRSSNWAESVEAVKDGNADIHSGLFKNKERSQWMAFSDPIHRAQTTLYFNASDTITPLEELNGQKVGILEGSFQESWLNENFPGIQPVFCSDGETLILTLLKKNVRAIFHETMAVEADLNRLGLAGKLKKSSEMVLSNAIYAGVPKFNKELLLLIDQGFSDIPKNEIAELELQWLPRKENRFYSKNTGSVTLTPVEKEFIAEQKPLTFSQINLPPLSIVDDPAQYKGLIADYLDLINRKTGLRFTFSPSKTWPGIIDRYKDGTIDVVPAIGKDVNLGRPILRSRAFVEFPLVIVTRDDVSHIGETSQLNHRKVSVGKGFASYYFLKNNYPDIELVQVDDIKTGLLALTNRKVDAFVGHMAVVIHTIQEQGLTNLKIAGEAGFTFAHRMGVDPRYPQAVSIINKALDTMTEEDHRAIYQKWISVHYEKSIDYGLIAKILGIGLIFIGIVIYWNRRLTKEVAERKQTEKKLLENERKTRAMSEAIHDGLIMIDEYARVMYWNSAAEDLFGITCEEAMGKDMHSLFVPKKYQGPAKLGLEQFAKTGKGPVVGKFQELTALRKDGTPFQVEVGVSSFQVTDKWYAVGTIRDITERNQTQETVQRIRTELQQIFDNAQVGILLLKNQRRIYQCNTRTAELLGYDSPRQMIGMSMADAHLNTKKFEEFGKQFYPILAKGEQVRTEYQLKQINGKGIWCSLSGRAVDPESPPDMEKGVIWVIDDISEKREAQQALKESEKRVSTILNAINTGTMIIDPEKRTIVDVNPAAARMIGLSRDKIIGRNCHRFVCPEQAHDCPIMDGLQEIDNAERILLTGDGRKIPILKTIVPVMLGDRKQILESFVDLTGQKEAEEELQQNLNELERFYKLAIGREEKMITLKEEINQALVQLGQKEKYTIR